MNIQQVRFVASQRADIDWQEVGGNENPYNSIGQWDSFEAYEARFEQIREEWDEFTRSAA